MEQIMRELDEKQKRKQQQQQEKQQERVDVMYRQEKIRDIEARKKYLEESIKNRQKNDIELQIEANLRLKESRRREEREQDLALMREFDKMQQAQEAQRNNVVCADPRAGTDTYTSAIRTRPRKPTSTKSLTKKAKSTSTKSSLATA